MTQARLLDVDPDAKRIGATKALVLVGTDVCPACAGPLHRENREEMPLLRGLATWRTQRRGRVNGV